MNRLPFILIPLINFLCVLLVNGAIELPLSQGWTITNQNESKTHHPCSRERAREEIIQIKIKTTLFQFIHRH